MGPRETQDQKDNPELLDRYLTYSTVTLRKGPLAHLDPQGCRESWDRKVTKETRASCVTVWCLQVCQAL